MKLDVTKGKSSLSIGYRSPGLSKDLDPAAKMALCKELGMSVIEPQINPREFPDLESARNYRRAADEADIEIPSAGTFLDHSIPGADLDEETKNILEIASILKVPYLFTLVQHPPEGIPHQESWDLTLNNLKNFSKRADDAGFKVALEPEWFLGSFERVMRMIEEVDHHNFEYINFDATNFFLNGSSPCEILEKAGDRISHGHIKDGFYRTQQRGEAPVGEGEVPWPEIFETLAGMEGHRYLQIEHCGTAEKVRAAAKAVVSFLEAGGWQES